MNKIQLGFAGLGAASRQILPFINTTAGAELVAVADSRAYSTALLKHSIRAQEEFQ